MGRFDGKVAVITGANVGIGLASAKRFAAEGASVFMTGRRQAEVQRQGVNHAFVVVQQHHRTFLSSKKKAPAGVAGARGAARQRRGTG